MLNPALLAALGNILPATSILTASEDTRPYECDGLTLFRRIRQEAPSTDVILMTAYATVPDAVNFPSPPTIEISSIASFCPYAA